MPDFAAQGLHVMTKPIGPICNLDCEYCYYLHKEELYPSGESWRMPESTLEAYIRQYIEAQPPQVREITFAWQGGEPTLLGREFFQTAVALQKKHAGGKVRLVNTLQTNAVLLDDAWCEFFREAGFLIGVSVDGPAELHDRYRYDKRGRATFADVLKGVKLLQKHEVEYNILTVVHRQNAQAGRRVYTYLRDLGARFFQFIPLVERRGVGAHPEPPPSEEAGGPYDAYVSSRSVIPEQFGDFLIDIFDHWVRRDVGRVFVQIFEEATRAWMGAEPGLCVFRRRCGRALAMEHNGDVFSCDHFVEPDYRLGNVLEQSLTQLANSPQQEQFGRDKEELLPDYCRQCEVRFACNGECPKNRFLETPDGQPHWNYLCAGYRKFFNHIDPYMKMIADHLKRQRPAAEVMQVLRQRESSKANQAASSRNQLCSCGSGRKYKRCCGRGKR